MSPLVKAGAVIAGLWWLTSNALASSSNTNANDPVPTTYPKRPSDPPDSTVDTGGNIVIVGGQCTSNCTGTHFDCPGDPECP